MNTRTAALVFSALAQETRLAAFRLVAAAHPEGLPAGEIARSLGVPLNTMSTHLSALVHANLVESERRGRFIIYRSRTATWRSLVAFLAATQVIADQRISAEIRALIKAAELESA